MPDWVSNLADILGILSFIASIVIWGAIDRVKDEVRSQAKEFTRTRTQVIGRLMGLRNSLVEDGITGLSTRSALRLELMTCAKQFNNLLTVLDKSRIQRTIKALSKSDVIDIEKTTLLLDWIIARFRKKEDQK